MWGDEATMKNILILAFLCLTVTGCERSYKEVTQARDKCVSLGGEPLYLKNINGTVSAVRCVVDGVTYRMGDY